MMAGVMAGVMDALRLVAQIPAVVASWFEWHWDDNHLVVPVLGAVTAIGTGVLLAIAFGPR